MAGQNSDFARVRAVSEDNLELPRRYVDCFDRFDCRLRRLLDDFDPGMKTAGSSACSTSSSTSSCR